MRKNFLILIVALIIILIGAVCAFSLLQPQYKSITVNGYQFEVPDSSSNVTSVNDNYKTYDDKEHNITVKSYAINNVNETNYTGAADMGVQLGTNAGQNATIENKTVYNNSGKYTYYDVSTYQEIVITCDSYDTMSHILKTMNKTDVTPNAENLTIDLTNLNSTNDTNNTNESTVASTTTKTTSKKTTTTSKKSSSSSSKSSSSSSDSDAYFVVNSKTGKKEYGPAHPNYGTANDYLQAEHSR